MVGQWPLKPLIGVRAPVPELILKAPFMGAFNINSKKGQRLEQDRSEARFLAEDKNRR